jgi:hypothetical protein
MKYPERIKIVEKLPYESRIGFVAFCVERCLKEAFLHPVAREQFENLPMLREALEMLWARAERREKQDPERIKAILAHLETYDAPAPDSESVIYNYDIAIVQAARVLKDALPMLVDPQSATPQEVASALEGPAQSVAQIYEDEDAAQDAEVAVIDAALQRLKKWGNKPFSRAVFEGIPEWKRGKLWKKYAENRVKGSALDDDE